MGLSFLFYTKLEFSWISCTSYYEISEGRKVSCVGDIYRFIFLKQFSQRSYHHL